MSILFAALEKSRKTGRTPAVADNASNEGRHAGGAHGPDANPDTAERRRARQPHASGAGIGREADPSATRSAAHDAAQSELADILKQMSPAPLKRRRLRRRLWALIVLICLPLLLTAAGYGYLRVVAGASDREIAAGASDAIDRATDIEGVWTAVADGVTAFADTVVWNFNRIVLPYEQVQTTARTGDSAIREDTPGASTPDDAAARPEPGQPAPASRAAGSEPAPTATGPTATFPTGAGDSGAADTRASGEEPATAVQRSPAFARSLNTAERSQAPSRLDMDRSALRPSPTADRSSGGEPASGQRPPSGPEAARGPDTSGGRVGTAPGARGSYGEEPATVSAGRASASAGGSSSIGSDTSRSVPTTPTADRRPVPAPARKPPGLTEVTEPAATGMGSPGDTPEEARAAGEAVVDSTAIARAHRRAVAALNGGQPAVAADTYLAILAEVPRDVDAVFGLATALQEMGIANEAEVTYEEVLAMDPGYVPALVNLVALLMDKAPTAAARELRALRPRYPDFAPLHAQLASVLIRLGELPQALQSIRRALELAPGNPSYLMNLAIVHDRMGNTARATEAYRRTLTASRDSSDAARVPLDQIRARLAYLEE